MSTINLSPNMNLPVPVVGEDPGPDYATNVNSSFGILDGHNHSLGSGVQITPSGLNINTDLSILSNNLTVVRSVRFTAQGSPLALGTDLGCVYESGVDLWYNDGNGNQIRITQSGGLAGTPGSISGLTAPASASYVAASSTFIFQSNVNTPANIDVGSVILRQVTTSPNGITLSSPTSLAANYTLTFPAGLPSSPTVLSSDASGNLSFVSGITAFDAVVGSSAQVAAGVANFTTLTAAIAAVSTNQSIKVLQGAYTENITMNKQIIVIGSGTNTVFTGNVSFASCVNAVFKSIRFSGTISFDSTSTGNIVSDCYGSLSTTTGTDNGTGNFVDYITLT